jgi:glycosyltransferase involved in cell wall biosynthesis
VAVPFTPVSLGISQRWEVHAVRVGLDATPLLGRPTGVGRYVSGLVAGLLDRSTPPDLQLTPFTWHGGDLDGLVPASPHVRAGGRRAPARLLRELWARGPFPPVEWLSGPVDLFHGTNYVLPPARRAAGVVTVHDLTYLHRPEWVNAESLRYRALVPVALRRAAAVCTDTAAVRTELLDAYPALDPARVHPTLLGVDGSWFAAETPDGAWFAARGLPRSYVLFVGTLEPRKNLRTLLAAYAGPLATADVPPLVVVGAPGWGDQIDAATLPEGRVHFTGYVEAADLPGVVAGASCLVLPSLYEGFGLPPLEAFAAGLPAVVGDVPALREVCGEHARYHAPLDAEALAHALTATLSDGGPTTAQARRAHARTFTWTRCADATLAAYEQALAP